MFILFGRWHFDRKAVAYRNDWCTVCERCIVARAIRSFDWFHIYLVPLIPLGHWRHWECPQCEKHPHLQRREGSQKRPTESSLPISLAEFDLEPAFPLIIQ